MTTNPLCLSPFDEKDAETLHVIIDTPVGWLLRQRSVSSVLRERNEGSTYARVRCVVLYTHKVRLFNV